VIGGRRQRVRQHDHARKQGSVERDGGDRVGGDDGVQQVAVEGVTNGRVLKHVGVWKGGRREGRQAV